MFVYKVLIMNNTRFQFYRERKVKSLAGFTVENTVSIHEVINNKVSYDPFGMKKKGTGKHNLQSLLKSKYRRFKRGSITRENFILFVGANMYLQKYSKRFM